ncbi:MAG TPA: tetratricopeptide repeat protein, partial [Polyangiaceae bacterium]|nr:tetratricopeptide repeat protein [Polyangiaceae bacterium]
MNRVLSRWVIAAALVLVGRVASAAPDSSGSSSSSSAGSTSSGPVCIGDQAKKTLETCPNGPTSFSGKGKQPEMSFHGKVEDIKKGDKKIEVAAPDTQMTAGFRDIRQQALKQRALALLVTEIQQLESLYKSTEARSKDRPQLLRRLAEDYVELENAAFREKTEAEVKRDNVKKTNPREAARQQAVANARKNTLDRSRKAAINYYNILVTDYSGQPSNTFPQNPPPPYPVLDEVYYYLAYEYEQSGDTANARRVYLDLITKTPNSKYLSNAYLAFGELFFNEALSDPSKWDPAKQAYQKVIAKPPPENKVYGYAWYKLAYVYWNMNDLPHALDAFKKTI